MNTKQPIPFDLEAAINGAPFMTEDGQEILEFYYFEKSTAPKPLVYFLVNTPDVARGAYKNGKAIGDDSPSPFDLVMKPKEPKTEQRWLLWQRWDNSLITFHNNYLSEEIALSALKQLKQDYPHRTYYLSETTITIPE